MTDRLLSDVRVLDLGTGIPGPYCAKMLADYGADVIKVEDPSSGDVTRRVGPFPSDTPHDERSGLFIYLNSNKRGITLDLQSEEGRRLLKELVKRVDVVVENFAPGTMDDWGLGWEQLEQVNPRLVLTSISPFGQTGPYRDYVFDEMVIYAMSSRMWSHGLPDREPLRLYPDIISFQIGATASTATMGALFASQRFGIGQQIDVSALEALVGNVDARTLVYTMTGERPQARTDPVVSVASGVLPCQDGFMFVQAGGARFTSLLQAIGEPEMAADPRFATPQGRQEHRDELDALVLPWMMDRTRREVFSQLQAHGVQCAPVQKVDETITDPQTVARGFYSEIDHPETGRVLYPGAPFIVEGIPWEVRSPAPRLGQHNEEIFSGELGLSDKELAALQSARIVG